MCGEAEAEGEGEGEVDGVGVGVGDVANGVATSVISHTARANGQPHANGLSLLLFSTLLHCSPLLSVIRPVVTFAQ